MYKKMYYRLFNALTEAMEHMLRMEYEEAYRILEKAQIDAEEIYLEGDQV